MPFFERPRRDLDDDFVDEDEDVCDDSPQANYLGGVVPLELLVARSDAAAVAVRSLVAYTDGFEFTAVAYTRSRRERRRRRFPRLPLLIDPFDLEDGEDLPDEFLRLGIEFPDGARVTNLSPAPWELGPDATEPAHGMESRGGGGSDALYEQEFWAWPVPGEGPLAFVCEWPAYDIPESRVEIDGALVAAAAARAQLIWPEDAGASDLTRSRMMRCLGTRGGRRPGEPPREPTSSPSSAIARAQPTEGQGSEDGRPHEGAANDQDR